MSEEEHRKETPQQFLETFARKGWLNSEMSDLVEVFGEFLDRGKPTTVLLFLRFFIATPFDIEAEAKGFLEYYRTVKPSHLSEKQREFIALYEQWYAAAGSK